MGNNVATGGVRRTHGAELASRVQLCKDPTSRENQAPPEGAAIPSPHGRQASQLGWALHADFTLDLLHLQDDGEASNANIILEVLTPGDTQ